MGWNHQLDTVTNFVFLYELGMNFRNVHRQRRDWKGKFRILGALLSSSRSDLNERCFVWCSGLGQNCQTKASKTKVCQCAQEESWNASGPKKLRISFWMCASNLGGVCFAPFFGEMIQFAKYLFVTGWTHQQICFDRSSSLRTLALDLQPIKVTINL